MESDLFSQHIYASSNHLLQNETHYGFLSSAAIYIYIAKICSRVICPNATDNIEAK